MGLLIGRGGSIGFPNKNTYRILNRPLMSYPLLAALNSKYLDKLYVSTDCNKIKKVTKTYKSVSIINRPTKLATSTALVDDVFVHAYNHVKNNLNRKIEFVVILMCNAPMILPSTIDKGIKFLRKNKKFDSAVTVSDYSMFSPIRARKIDKEGSLKPFIPFKNFKFKIDSNRQKKNAVYFHDCGVSVVRPECLEKISIGLLPQKWMGKKIYPLKQEGGLDIDYAYELPLAENWLKQKGFTKKKLPYKLKS
jgi:CMP-N-acetylneuraminic acid synthetase